MKLEIKGQKLEKNRVHVQNEILNGSKNASEMVYEIYNATWCLVIEL